MFLLVWKQKLLEKAGYGLRSISSIWRLHRILTVFPWSSHYVEPTELPDTHCPFLTVSDLISNLLHIGFYPQVTVFVKLFSLIKIPPASYSTIVWINNLPRDNPNLHIISCLSCFAQKEASDCWWREFAKGPVTCIFWAEQQSQFAKGTKWVFFCCRSW